MNRQKIGKILALAFDPACVGAEAINAFESAKAMILAGGGWFEYSGAQQTETSRSGPDPLWMERRVGFGKYKGRTMGMIWDMDPSYVEWLAEKCTTAPWAVRFAAQNIVNFYYANA